MAVIVTFVDPATPRVVTVKVAEVAFAGTVTLDGTVAAAVFELESATEAPPGGAYPVRVTVPVDITPPITLVGLTETPELAAGVTVKVAVLGTAR